MRIYFLCLSLLNILNLNAQHFAFGIDVPHGLTGIFKPSAEVALSKNFSLGLALESGTYSEGTTGTNFSQAEVYSVKGSAWIAEARLYPFAQKKQAPRGFSVGMYYRRGNFEERYNGEDYSTNQQAGMFNPQTQGKIVDITTEGSTSNIGISFAYKFNAGPIIIEPLIGFGSVNGEWNAPNERERIDPFFKDELDDFQYSGRIEVKLGFYFPQMKNFVEYFDKLPSGEWQEQTQLKAAYKENVDSTKNIKLIAYRPFKLEGFAINYTLSINDSAVMKVKNRSYHFIELDKAGEYKISAKTEAEKAIKVKLEAGKTYYLRCTFGIGIFIGRPKFKFVSTEKGEAEVLKIIQKQKDY